MEVTEAAVVVEVGEANSEVEAVAILEVEVTLAAEVAAVIVETEVGFEVTAVDFEGTEAGAVAEVAHKKSKSFRKTQLSCY